ncbi:MAG: methyltransferase domain-containing protein [Mangrovicoccus sp.]
MTAKDWSPEIYARFRGLRLRPAMDLLAQLPDLPDGPIIDLGCGSGAVGPALKARFPKRRLFGVDQSPTMLEEAEATGCYYRLTQMDLADWQPEEPPAAIFSNAVLNWLPDHPLLVPHLAQALMPGGALALQMPKQQEAPSHALLRSLSAEIFPDRFDWSNWRDTVHDGAEYLAWLQDFGPVTIWETEFYQILAPQSLAHPVRVFTQSTAARRVLDQLTEVEAARFFTAYDAALEQAYPPRSDGSVVMQFRRLFVLLHKSAEI